MVTENYLIISSDTHAGLPDAQYKEYLEPRYREAFDEDLVVPYKKQLFPDLDALGKSEQHRFELLLAHWDIETAEQAL